jgi:hypothetical protein
MINNENYFSPENSLKYMGTSQFKTGLDCQTRMLAEIKGDYIREESGALLQGKFFDAYFENNLELFIAQNSSVIYQKSGKEYAYITDVQRAISRVNECPEWLRLASGEQQVIMTGKIQGVDFKIMIDSLLKGEAIVDRKLMRGFDDGWGNGEKLPWWKLWRYDIQAAIYKEIYEQNTGEDLPFILVGASKEKTVDIGIWQFSDETLQNALSEVKAYAEMLDDIKRGNVEPVACGVCDYCKAKKDFKKGEYEII